MQYIELPDGSVIFPSLGARETCPQCHGELIAHCGYDTTFYWAHRRSNPICGPSEEEKAIAKALAQRRREKALQWRAEWQGLVPPAQRDAPYGRRKADILSHDGTRVLKLSVRSVSAEEIWGQEKFYADRGLGMAWLFNVRSAVDSGRLTIWPERNNRFSGKPFHAFQWEGSTRTIARCTNDVFFDTGHGVYKAQVYGKHKLEGSLDPVPTFHSWVSFRNPAA